MRTLGVVVSALLLASCLVAGDVRAAGTCTVSSGDHLWSDVAQSGIWSGCTPDGSATFRIEGEATVTTAGDITLTTGAIIVDGGTLEHSCGTTIRWSGGSGGLLEVASGLYEATGCVIWSGRVASDLSYDVGPPSTASFSANGPIASAGDFVVVGDDDPADADAAVTQPPRVGPGPPAPDTYRPSYSKWKWYRIERVSASTLTIDTNEWAWAGGTDAAAYAGVRGPAVQSPVQLASLVAGPHSLTTRVGLPIQLVDGDLGAQYVEFAEGPCLGWMFKILWTQSRGAQNPSDVYVAGDASGCLLPGAQLPRVRVNFGMRDGDPIEVVRPATLDGNLQAQFRWHGGRVRATKARFARLFGTSGSRLSTPSGGIWGNCVLCIYPTSPTAMPEFAESWFVDSAVVLIGNAAYPGDEWIFGFVGWNGMGTGYPADLTAPMDASALQMERLYIADQWADAGSAAGAHGIFALSATIDPLRIRVERLSDDGIGVIQDAFGGTAPLESRLRHAIVEEVRAGPTNSQQGVEWMVRDRKRDVDGVSQVIQSRFTVRDVLAVGCQAGCLRIEALNSEFARMAIGGSALTAGFSIDLTLPLYAALPPGALATNPNVLRDSILSAYGEPTAANALALGSRLASSVVIGTEAHVGSLPVRNAADRIEGSFIDVPGSSYEVILDRTLPNAPLFAFPTITIRDSVLSSRWALRLCNGFDGTVPKTGFELDHVHIAVREIAYQNGVLTGCITDASDAQQFSADGLLVTATSVGTRDFGLGRGWPGFGTAQGARVADACVETLLAGADPNSYGAALQATDAIVPSLGPDADATAEPLRAFLAPPDATACDAHRPRRLGLAQLGTEQALLGDGFLSQLDLWSSGTLGAPACGNGFDDDGDGLVDYPEDPGCGSDSAATESPQCSDGIDNDGDGRVDLQDLQCLTPAGATEMKCGLGVGVLVVIPIYWVYRRQRRRGQHS